MISVCIPVYNFDVSALIMQLHDQQKHMDVPVEILVIDDASSKEWKSANINIQNLVTKYIELDVNIGRSAIRNLFLKHCAYANLIFLDCDGLLISDEFLKNYSQAISNAASVVVGGREYGDRPNDNSKMLRWMYGKFRESRPITDRLKNPYASFMTNNFMIDKGLLETIRFDETLIRYGHEDTLFGYELERQSVPLVHIYNPVLNNDLESASTYLIKTKEGIQNLYKISSSLNHIPKFTNGIKLLRFWRKSMGFSWLFKGGYSLFKRSIEANLLGAKPNLRLFDLYKLNEIITQHQINNDK